jgi:thioredoxin-related protein
MKGFPALLGLGLCLAVAAGCGEKGAPGNSSKGTADAKSWMPFNEGMARAAKEKKHVVIDFYTSWCHWCKVMDKETFSDPEVKKYLRAHFVTIRVDAEDKTQKLTYKGEEHSPFTLGRKFGVRGFPSLAYLDREGELVTVVPGFVPAKTFLSLLQYMEKECYTQRMSFDEFLQRKGDCDTAKSR